MIALTVNPQDLASFQRTNPPKPQLREMDLLVRVQASAINPVDILVREGRAEQTLGWDACGEVVEVGGGVSRFDVGDRVFYAGDIQRAGSNAQFQAVDERLVGLAPLGLEAVEAAALPLTSLTAWEALYEKAQLKAGERLLIINGSGGVGSMAIQLAKRVGAQVVATASRPETKAWVESLGADHVVNHHKDLVQELQTVGPVDVILCCHDTTAHFEAMSKIIAPFGRIVSIVPTQDRLPMQLLFEKSVTFAWELMFTRSSHQTSDQSRQGEVLSKVARMFDQGLLHSTMTKTISLTPEGLSQAHQEVAQGKIFGKLTFNHDQW